MYQSRDQRISTFPKASRNQSQTPQNLRSTRRIHQSQSPQAPKRARAESPNYKFSLSFSPSRLTTRVQQTHLSLIQSLPPYECTNSKIFIFFRISPRSGASGEDAGSLYAQRNEELISECALIILKNCGKVNIETVKNEPRNSAKTPKNKFEPQRNFCHICLLPKIQLTYEYPLKFPDILPLIRNIPTKEPMP